MTSPPVSDAASTSPTRLGVNTRALIAGRVLVAAAGWAGSVLVARHLGDAAWGQFSLVFAILGLLSIVTDLGVGRIAVAGLLDPEQDAARFAGTYIVLRTVLGIIGYGVALLVVVLLGHESIIVTATAVAGLVVLISTPSHAYDIAFQVKDRLVPLAVAGSLSQLAQLALTIALVLRGASLVWLTVPFVVKEVLVLAWKVPAAHRMVDFRYGIDIGIWRRLLGEAVPLTAGAAFVTLYYRIDSVMLGSLDTDVAVGRYAVAYKFVDLMHFVPSALGIAILAPLAATWKTDPDRFATSLDSGLRLLAVAAGGSLVGFWLHADDIIELLYGPSFAVAGDATRLVVTAEAFGFFSAAAITALVAAGRHRVYPLITLTGLVVNVATNSVLIPRSSFEGAAVATVVTEVLVAGLLWTQFRRIHRVASAGRLAVAVGAGMAAGLAVGLVVGLAAPWYVAASLAGVTYLVVVELDGALGEHGWRQRKQSAR